MNITVNNTQASMLNNNILNIRVAATGLGILNFPSAVYTRSIHKWGLSALKLAQLNLSIPAELTEQNIQLVLTQILRGSLCIGVPQGCSNEKILYKELSCQSLNLDFFDKLVSAGCVISTPQPEAEWAVGLKCSGNILGRLPEIGENDDSECSKIILDDKLKETMLLTSSDAYSSFNEESRNELIFQLFKSISIGGVYNQYERNTFPYLAVLRHMIRNLVYTKQYGGATVCESKAYMIYDWEKTNLFQDKGQLTTSLTGTSYIQSYYPQWCYIILTRITQTAVILYFDGSDLSSVPETLPFQ